MKIKITSSALKPVLKALVFLIVTVKYFFKKELLTKRYYIHFLVTAALLALPSLGLNAIGAPQILKIILLASFAWYINARWETYWFKKGAPYDDVDVVFGIYGAISISFL
jgi:hypothetical protein